VAAAERAELVFVVDVSSLTKTGFTGTTEYEGMTVEVQFDDGEEGVFLSPEMAGRLHVKKGSALAIAIEDELNEFVESKVAAVGKKLLISNSKVYYQVGRDGGAIIRLRKG
jgi:hypothetical protein